MALLLLVVTVERASSWLPTPSTLRTGSTKNRLEIEMLKDQEQELVRKQTDR